MNGAEARSKWDETLRAILAGTAASTGDEFFRALVSNLASALHVRCAFVSEFADGNTRVRTLACWTGEGFVDNFEYDLADTPCEQVLRGEIRLYPEGVQALFPKDNDLVKLGAESYLAIPLVDPSGNVLGHLAVIDDKAMAEPRDMPIFEIFAVRAAAELLRKRAEQAQRQSEERFHKIFDHSNDAIFIIDPPQDKIIDVNPKACEMLGYSRERLTSMSISEIHPNEMPQLQAFAQSVSRNGHGWTGELTCLTSTGRFLAAEISASMIAISGRSRMIALVRDISERKRLEQERKRAEEELRRANQRMKGELLAAAKIQQSLLPKVSPDIAGVNFAWALKPCDELAGDILNVFLLDEKHVGLYLADVSGHGVPAALLSTTLNRVLSPLPGHSLLRERLEGSGYRVSSPAEVAGQLNEEFPMDPATRQYFTLLYGILNWETREFRYVPAGHPGPVYLSSSEGPMILDTNSFPIGFFRGVNYEEHSITMKPADRLYLYSDGITEATNINGEEFGKERLIRVLVESRPMPLNTSLSSLLAAVKEWCGAANLGDDISILAVEITR